MCCHSRGSGAKLKWLKYHEELYLKVIKKPSKFIRFCHQLCNVLLFHTWKYPKWLYVPWNDFQNNYNLFVTNLLQIQIVSDKKQFILITPVCKKLIAPEDLLKIFKWIRSAPSLPADVLTSLGLNELTHWCRDKMAAFFQKTFSKAFSSMKMYKF